MTLWEKQRLLSDTEDECWPNVMTSEISLIILRHLIQNLCYSWTFYTFLVVVFIYIVHLLSILYGLKPVLSFPSGIYDHSAWKFVFPSVQSYVSNNTPSKCHLQTPTKKHVKSHLKIWHLQQTDLSLNLCYVIQGCFATQSCVRTIENCIKWMEITVL